ncbi:hypothetical protein HAX54_007823 [Datura stramonium]|uniref:Uncharacterized protein n=1 Tax=Datura stramonium TaxID=4076 RepID=A0ABS8RVJ3_DATST|nr:hypothetical protein [Datura stramonium]
MAKKCASHLLVDQRHQLDRVRAMDASSTVPAVVPTVSIPTIVVMRLLNVLETLVPNHGGLPVPQTTS